MQRQMEDLEVGQTTGSKKHSTTEYNQSISLEEEAEVAIGQQETGDDWVQKREIHQLQVDSNLTPPKKIYRSLIGLNIVFDSTCPIKILPQVWNFGLKGANLKPAQPGLINLSKNYLKMV